MEPLDDKELSALLREWQAPDAPPSLAAKVLPRSGFRWRWLATGNIRVPVPVAIALLLAVVLFLYMRRPEPPPVASPGRSVSLADFQPVKQLEPRVIGRANENR